MMMGSRIPSHFSTNNLGVVYNGSIGSNVSDSSHSLNSEIIQLEDEIDDIDARMRELRRGYIDQEQLFADKDDDMEVEYGHAMEKLRSEDVAAKQLVYKQMKTDFVVIENRSRKQNEEQDDDRLTSSSSTQITFEELWQLRKKAIIDKQAVRMNQMESTHSDNMAILQAELDLLLKDHHEMSAKIHSKRKQQQRQLLAEQRKHQRPPFLGLDLVEHSEKSSSSSSSSGVRVTCSRGPALQAGIREGDLLINMQVSRNVISKTEFNEMVSQARPGEHLAFLVERGGIEHETVLAIPSSSAKQ